MEHEKQDFLDSEDEAIMELVPKKYKKNGIIDFDNVAYTFILNNKVHALKNELSKTKELVKCFEHRDYENTVLIDQLLIDKAELKNVIKTKENCILNYINSLNDIKDKMFINEIITVVSTSLCFIVGTLFFTK